MGVISTQQTMKPIEAGALFLQVSEDPVGLVILKAEKDEYTWK